MPPLTKCRSRFNESIDFLFTLMSDLFIVYGNRNCEMKAKF